MEKWDGICGKYRYKNPDGLMVDHNGTIRTSDGGIWCPAFNLNRHLHRLWNVTEGKVVENMAYMALTGKNW